MKNMRNVDRKGGKMDTRWTGPYIIQSNIGKGRYTLLNVQTGQPLKQAINSSRLKKYLEKDQNRENKETPEPSTKPKDSPIHISNEGLHYFTLYICYGTLDAVLPMEISYTYFY